jgi:molecular chaperone GrpE
MSDPKGPKLDLPDDLVNEIAESVSGDSSPEITTVVEGAVDEELADAPASSEGDDVGDDGEKLAQMKDRHLRLAAEFENFKRRALKERQDLLNFATEGLMKELLGTIDNLERALGHVKQEEDVDKETLLEGVDLTLRSLMQTLEKGGLKVVEAEGVPFDPAVHEAIRQVPSDEHPAGTVIEVFQKGYMLKNRLLRPALVAVAGG